MQPYTIPGAALDEILGDGEADTAGNYRACNFEPYRIHFDTVSIPLTRIENESNRNI